MDLLSISKCPARACNRSKYCRRSWTERCLHSNEQTTILNIIKRSLKYIFLLHSQKNKVVQKWICYQSLNVQQKPLTDRNTGDNQNLWKYISWEAILNKIKTSPYRFFLHRQKKVRVKNGSVINLQMSSKSL